MQKKIYFLGIIIFILSIFGCSGKDQMLNNLDKSLMQSTTVKIYDINLDKLSRTQGIYKRLHEFPFISTDPMLDFKGNFPIEFYQTKNYHINAADIKDVDFWKLRDYPFILDVIYVKPIWLENYKYVSKDLFENICYSYNISKREQAVLKWWLKNGGVLWVESGIYATGFEKLTKYGRVNLKFIKHRINILTNNLHFINFPVSTVTYVSKYISISGYTPKTISFNNLKITDSFFNGLESLKVILRYPVETFFSIPEGAVIKDRAGNPLVSIIPYYEGKIIFLFPFEYVDSYKNGELLRWKLLQYIYSKPHYSQPDIVNTDYKAKDNSTGEKIKDNKTLNEIK